MKNSSGIIPLEDKVLVLPHKVAEKAGMIVKPDVTREQEQLAQTVGVLVQVGPNAFEEWADPIPESGELVFFTKYAGARNILGADGQRYQLLSDRDITALVTEHTG